MNVVKELSWDAKTGIGYFPAEPAGVYDESYFEKYVGYSKTQMGRALTSRRILFVGEHIGFGDLVDVGIGCGHFVEERNRLSRGSTRGYDVNPAGIRFLHGRGLWRDPYTTYPVSAISLFDALEHMRQPESLLEKVEGWVFVSIPIFRDQGHAFGSKHFRPDEHFWYFTKDGLIHFMRELGFELRAESDFEIKLGREDIRTFAFQRPL